MPKVLEKVERRLGEKLFLKGHRCASPKCAHIRRGYPPGAHGGRKGRGRRRGLSEYAELLREKQKVRYMYGLDDKDVSRYAKRAASRSGVFSSNFLCLLETRLDNVVFRLGFAESRRAARQLVSHGHITVNPALSKKSGAGARTVTIPSYQVKPGDEISIKEHSLSSPLFSDLETRLKKYETPAWLEPDLAQKSGSVSRLPEAEDAGITMDITKIKEFYSR